jgi:hypothetical protein
MITVFNLENGTCNLISLVNTSGDVLSDFKTTQSTSDIDIVCSAVIDIPNSVSFFSNSNKIQINRYMI